MSPVDWAGPVSENSSHPLIPLKKSRRVHMRERAGSVTEMKLVSVYMETFSPLSEIPVGKTEISATEPARSLI